MQRRRDFGLGSVVSIIFGVLTAASFLLGGLFLRSFTQPIDGGVVVQGTVIVGIETQNNGQTVEALFVQFVDPATGSTHRVLDFISVVEGGGVGDTRNVSLLPGQPTTARLVGGSMLWITLVGLGVLTLAAVVTAIWWSSKPTSKTKQSTGPTMTIPESQRAV